MPNVVLPPRNHFLSLWECRPPRRPRRPMKGDSFVGEEQNVVVGGDFPGIRKTIKSIPYQFRATRYERMNQHYANEEVVLERHGGAGEEGKSYKNTKHQHSFFNSPAFLRLIKKFRVWIYVDKPKLDCFGPSAVLGGRLYGFQSGLTGENPWETAKFSNYAAHTTN